MRFKRISGIMAAIFNILRPLLFIVGLLALIGFRWPFGPDGPQVVGVPAFIPGLLLGTALMVLIPYLKEGLQSVADTGAWSAFLPFDWRYLALFLLPAIGFSVAFLTIEGLWETAHQWGFVQTVSMGYTGVNLVKEVGKASIALYQIANAARAKRLM
jgi:hypothetical protein